MIHTRSNERGVALLAVLLFGIAAMSYAFSVLQSSVAAQEQSRAARAAVRAYQAAEAGVHRVVARLNQRNEPLRWGGELTQTLQGTGENAISFVARVELAASDNADNDRDGLVDEDDESYLRELVCTGQADGIRRTIRVTLFSEQQTHTVGSAVYLGDTGADVTFEGNAFRIAGEDHDMDRNPIGSDSVVGLGVGGIATGIGSQVKPKRADQITGTGGSPSVAQVLPPDLTGFLSDALRIANVRFDGGSVNPKDGDWGTLEAPAIVYSRGSLEVAGQARGRSGGRGTPRRRWKPDHFGQFPLERTGRRERPGRDDWRRKFQAHQRWAGDRCGTGTRHDPGSRRRGLVVHGRHGGCRVLPRRP